jgi:hypothetical protein
MQDVSRENVSTWEITTSEEVHKSVCPIPNDWGAT